MAKTEKAKETRKSERGAEGEWPTLQAMRSGGTFAERYAAGLLLSAGTIEWIPFVCPL